MIALTVDDLLAIARRVVGPDVVMRDPGLLASAAARPSMAAFGDEAYPDLSTKAAALMHSLAQMQIARGEIRSTRSLSGCDGGAVSRVSESACRKPGILGAGKRIPGRFRTQDASFATSGRRDRLSRAWPGRR